MFVLIYKKHLCFYLRFSNVEETRDSALNWNTSIVIFRGGNLEYQCCYAPRQKLRGACAHC